MLGRPDGALVSFSHWLSRWETLWGFHGFPHLCWLTRGFSRYSQHVMRRSTQLSDEPFVHTSSRCQRIPLGFTDCIDKPICFCPSFVPSLIPDFFVRALASADADCFIADHGTAEPTSSTRGCRSLLTARLATGSLQLRLDINGLFLG